MRSVEPASQLRIDPGELYWGIVDRSVLPSGHAGREQLDFLFERIRQRHRERCILARQQIAIACRDLRGDDLLRNRVG